MQTPSAAFNVFGGMTFRIEGDSHLWFVLSDSEQDPQNVLYANLTAYRQALGPRPDNDPACFFYAGDHPFVTRLTCVNYAGAHIASVNHLSKRYREQKLKLDPTPLSAPLLKRARESAVNSDFISFEWLELLKAQSIA